MALSRCPVCGGAASVTHLKGDYYDFGWMAGCKSYSLFDTIHGITDETPTEQRPVVFGYSKAEVIEKWEEKVKEWKD